jgi:hypothetical protein
VLGHQLVMSNDGEHYIRWEPQPRLPEHPFEKVDVAFADGELTATATYGQDCPELGLRITFAHVEAFKVYEEFSDPWMETKCQQPMVNNPDLNAWVWPLQEVKQSRWIARVVGRNGPLEAEDWRHLTVVTGQYSLHVMTASEPREVTLLVRS